jgi:hypothetical protein
MRAHLTTESYLEELARTRPGFTYTNVREGIYSESFAFYASFFDPKNPVDEIQLPHDGSGPGIAWAKRDELGEASAKLFAQHAANPSSFQFTNKTILLSGPKVFTLAETVDLVSKIINKPIRIREISVDEYTALPQVPPNMMYHGVDYSKGWATSYEAIRRGECAVASPLLGEILGREPEGYETTLRNLILG